MIPRTQLAALLPLIVTCLLAPASAHAAPAATPEQRKQAAHARVKSERARRTEAMNRLERILASPPTEAPPWMKRDTERAKATGGKRGMP